MQPPHQNIPYPIDPNYYRNPEPQYYPNPQENLQNYPPMPLNVGTENLHQDTINQPQKHPILIEDAAPMPLQEINQNNFKNNQNIRMEFKEENLNVQKVVGANLGKKASACNKNTIVPRSRSPLRIMASPRRDKQRVEKRPKSYFNNVKKDQEQLFSLKKLDQKMLLLKDL